MTWNRREILVDDLCAEIDHLRVLLEDSENREKHWRDQYSSLLDETTMHSKQMVGGLMLLMLKGKVVP